MKHFERFATRKLKSLVSHLEDYKKSVDPETLHLIRLDIKKIKAILLATDSCVEGLELDNNLKPFRDIFRRAGKIREQTIRTELLLKYKVRIHTARRDDNNSIGSFMLRVPGFKENVKEKLVELKPFFGQVHKDDLSRYLQKKRAKIKSKLYPRIDIRSIHKTRKQIKRVIYLSIGDNTISKRQVKFYSEVQRLIGGLHDKMVLIEFLKERNGSKHRDLKKIKAECLLDRKELERISIKYYQQAGQII